MDIKEFDNKLKPLKEALASFSRRDQEKELLAVIKEEMTKRGLNAIKVDLHAEIGDDVDRFEWSLMTIYEDSERTEWASTVYFDESGNIQFADYFEQEGFTETVVTPYRQNPEIPAMVFSVGPLNLEEAKPFNEFGYSSGDGIMTGECDPYDNGIVHLATILGKCIEIYDNATAGK